MYVPAHNVQNDPSALLAFMRAHPFATVITRGRGGTTASHLPLMVDPDPWRITGHMARANPGWEGVEDSALTVFHGPHRYISATWYDANDTVPTWNYLAVHAVGTFTRLEDPAQCASIIARLAAETEGPQAAQWLKRLSPEMEQKLMQAIVCFRIDVTSLDGKWKLNQNHTPERRRRVIAALRSAGDADGLAIADAMALTLGDAVPR
jgi:transcriptional regulator